MSPPPLFQARDLGRRYGTGAEAIDAVTGVSLAVERGAFACVEGPSGSGKSTLLALLSLLDVPTLGEVAFDGRSMRGVSDAARARLRRRLGFVFQTTPMLRGMTVEQNVAAPLVPWGLDADTRRRRAALALERTGTARFAASRPERLSGGERQRVGLARALVVDPVAIVADEPTTHLDEEAAAAVARLLSDLHASGVTILCASHDPRIRDRASERVRLERGRILSVNG